MIEEKYISVQKHPSLDLYIYNYTQKAQFDKVWNNETLTCRGLIMDDEQNIIARPFPKFFNLQEAIDKGDQIPVEDFIITEKMDGSLGILYWEGDVPQIATRGSFVSDQSARACQILRDKYPKLELNRDWTALFEIIYPENRIVVDYQGMADLVLLSVVDTQTGVEVSYGQIQGIAKTWGMPVVKKYNAIKSLSKIEQRPNAEGYVIFFPKSNVRFKIKFDEYVRLHRLITGVNARRIWDLLRNNEPFDELFEKVPDEFFNWVKTTRESLLNQYANIEDISKIAFITANSGNPSRREFAGLANVFKHSGILFKMLDNQPYDEMIWKIIKPKHEVPFKIEI